MRIHLYKIGLKWAIMGFVLIINKTLQHINLAYKLSIALLYVLTRLLVLLGILGTLGFNSLSLDTSIKLDSQASTLRFQCSSFDSRLRL